MTSQRLVLSGVTDIGTIEKEKEETIVKIIVTRTLIRAKGIVQYHGAFGKEFQISDLFSWKFTVRISKVSRKFTQKEPLKEEKSHKIQGGNSRKFSNFN